MFKSRRINLHWADMNMAEMELEKLILHYSQSNRADGKSPKTIAWYGDADHFYPVSNCHR